MVAYSTSTSLEFKNIGGLLRIGVTGDASIASVMLSGNAGEPIAGHFEISKSDLASGSLDFAPGEGSAQFVSTSVTMTCTENVRLDANSPTYFYFALPAAEYTEGFTVTLTDSEGNTCLRQTHNSVSIERATLKSMEPIAFEKDKALTVTLGEIAANSVTWNIEGNPSTDLRTLLVTKAMWDHFIAQEYYLDNPQKLTSEILAAYSATIPTDDNGRYEETATQARAVNSMQPVQEDNDYLVLAAYFSGTQSVGVIPAPVPVHTPAATGPAPEVNVTVSSAGSTTIDVLTTTSNASGILTALFFKSDYDNVFSREGIDEELIAKVRQCMDGRAGRAGQQRRIYTPIHFASAGNGIRYANFGLQRSRQSYAQERNNCDRTVRRSFCRMDHRFLRSHVRLRLLLQPKHPLLVERDQYYEP